MKPGRIVALVFGCLAALIGIALFFGTVALGFVYGTQRDSDGYFSTGTTRLVTTTAALRSEKIDLGSDENPDRWPFRDGDLATVRVRAQAPAGEEIFVGIGHSSEVDEYLAGVAHDEVTDIHWRNDRVRYRRVPGDEVALPPPGEQDIWEASAEGPGRQVVAWDVEGGNWSVVVMNADGSQGVDADVRVGVKVNVLPWIILGIGIGASRRTVRRRSRHGDGRLVGGDGGCRCCLIPARSIASAPSRSGRPCWPRFPISP